MIYWFTGQPGHGKTLHGIDKALQWVDEGRLVYACNIRKFNYEKAGMLPMSPEQFRDWMNFLPDGAAAIVDEAYEHSMLPKRAPGMKVPPHVQELAKHRHRGLDFIFISQSPAKQVDEFVHDLIERHVHVRRRFGTPMVHLREFDRFERNPEKAHPINLRRVLLPKRPRGLYESTEVDTTEKKVPWYYYAAAILGVSLIGGTIYTVRGVKESFTPTSTTAVARADGAPATAGVGGGQSTNEPKWKTPGEYAIAHLPRFPTMPHTAPIYDGRSITADPQLFCMSSAPGFDANDNWEEGDCTCTTEQGTDYQIELVECQHIARHSTPYNHYKMREDPQQSGMGAGGTPAVMAAPAAAPSAAVGISSPDAIQARYGQFRATTPPADPSFGG